MQIFIFIAFLLLIGSITAHYAIQRGRSPFNWFMIGMLFGIMGLLLLFLMPNLATQSSSKTQVQTSVAIEQNPPSEYQGKQWFYLDDSHAQQGPVSFRNLLPVWEKKGISSHSFVWCEGMSDWKTIEDLPRFKETLNAEL